MAACSSLVPYFKAMGSASRIGPSIVSRQGTLKRVTAKGLFAADVTQEQENEGYIWVLEVGGNYSESVLILHSGA